MIRKRIIVVVALVALGVVFWFGFEGPIVSSVDPVHRICGACGLDVAEIDQLIDDAKHSTLTQEASLELYRDTFEQREDSEWCIECAEAVLDAAER